jgi:hypothetical protein
LPHFQTADIAAIYSHAFRERSLGEAGCDPQPPHILSLSTRVRITNVVPRTRGEVRSHAGPFATGSRTVVNESLNDIPALRSSPYGRGLETPSANSWSPCITSCIRARNRCVRPDRAFSRQPACGSLLACRPAFRSCEASQDHPPMVHHSRRSSPPGTS